MTSPVKTPDSAAPRAPESEVEALIKEARQRQRRRRGSIAVVLLALAAIAFVLLNGAGGSKRPARNDPVSHRAPQSEVLRGADTTLLMWPAGAPEFGDLPGGGPGTTVRVDDLSTGTVAVDRIPNIAGGDFPYQIVPVGRRLVYNGDAGVSVVGDDHFTAAALPRVLGRATWFVPSVNGNVLLVHARDAYPVSFRLASIRTSARGPAVKLPKGTDDLIEGTARGLLLFKFTALHRSNGGTIELWHPHGPSRTLAHLPNGFSDADQRLVDYASGCRWKTAMYSGGASGFQVCAQLHVIDLLNGQRFSFAAPAGTLGWVMSQFSLDSGTAPRTMLAAQAAIAPARAGQARLFILRLGEKRASAIAVPDSTAPTYAKSAWSTNGSWLFYERSGERLGAFRPATRTHPAQTRAMAVRCCQYAAMVSAPSQSH